MDHVTVLVEASGTEGIVVPLEPVGAVPELRVGLELHDLPVPGLERGDLLLGLPRQFFDLHDFSHEGDVVDVAAEFDKLLNGGHQGHATPGGRFEPVYRAQGSKMHKYRRTLQVNRGPTHCRLTGASRPT